MVVFAFWKPKEEIALKPREEEINRSRRYLQWKEVRGSGGWLGRLVVPPHRGWWRSSPTPRWQVWESRSSRGRRNPGRRSRGGWRSSGGGGVKIWMIQNFFQKSSSRDSLFKSRSQKLHFCSFTRVTFTFYSFDFDILIGIFINQGLYATWRGSGCFESLWK